MGQSQKTSQASGKLTPLDFTVPGSIAIWVGILTDSKTLLSSGLVSIAIGLSWYIITRIRKA